MAGERTEKATPKRREDERRKGHVALSQDMVTAISTVAFFLLFRSMGKTFGRKLAAAVQGMLEALGDDVSGLGTMRSRFIQAGGVFLGVLFPVLLVTAVTSVAGTVAQTRMPVSPGQLKFDFRRLSPLQGIRRMFSVRSLFELAKSLLKVAAVGAVIYAELRPQISRILLLFDSSLGDALGWVASVLVDVGLKASLAMLAIGAADYFYQWWSFQRGIRMSKEELREEFRQTEGNPETKSRIRGLQRKMARQRMMQAVAQADVVIRNPTHFAVALRYDAQRRGAPVVVAKGRDQVALRIVEVAQRHHVYVTENRPLARALYQAVEIGEEIPAGFYRAVAEVLAYIYRLRRAGRQ